MFQNPTIQRLRALEHSRMAKLTLRRERIATAFKRVNTTLKQELRESIATQTATIQELADIFLAPADKTDDES